MICDGLRAAEFDVYRSTKHVTGDRSRSFWIIRLYMVLPTRQDLSCPLTPIGMESD